MSGLSGEPVSNRDSRALPLRADRAKVLFNRVRIGRWGLHDQQGTKHGGCLAVGCAAGQVQAVPPIGQDGS